MISSVAYRLLDVFCDHWPLDVPSAKVVRALGIRQAELPKFVDYARDFLDAHGIKCRYHKRRGYWLQGVAEIDLAVGEGPPDYEEFGDALRASAEKIASASHVADMAAALLWERRERSRKEIA